MALTPGVGTGAAELWYRVHAVSADAAGGTAAADYAAILPAALNAARRRRPFIVGWLSRGGSSPLELITTAEPLPANTAGAGGFAGSADPPGRPASRGAPGSASAAPVEMLFPWGARGSVIGENVIAELDRLAWAACPGRRVPAGDDPAAQPWPGDDHRPPTLFESALQALMGRSFCWLVVADSTDLLAAETSDLRTELTVLRRYDDEQTRFEATRIEQRLTELDNFREAGLWHVRVLVGAATEPDLELIAPLLVGSADLGAHPYRLRCPAGPLEFADALAARLTDPADGSAVPFAATAGVLAAMTGLPRHEVPGVRLMRPGYFDVTADERLRGPAVELGKILDGRDREVGAFAVPLATINRHALVTGATGSGKSQTVRHLLEELTSAGISWLAVEPVKSEYGVMAVRLAGADNERHREVTVINPADPEAVPLSVNPLAPEPGYPVQGHIDMVRALFLAAFDAREPFPQIIAQALQRVYEEHGWDPLTGGGRADTEAPPAVPTLARLQSAALAVISDVGYGRELQADMRGFVDVRLRSLRTGSAGRFFEGGHPADIAALLERNVVLALDDVANDEDKAFVIGALLIRIVEHVRLRSGPAPAESLRHVIVLEEAHRLLRAGRDGAGAHAVELFAGLLAEIRAYGEGIVIAEQIPAKLVPDVVKNTALKVLHRLPAADDRQLVGAAMNVDEQQSRQVVSLPPGEAVAFADGMDRPMRIRVPFGGDRERRAAAQAEAAARGAAVLSRADSPLLLGRRSAACGPSCTGVRPCTLMEMRAADVLARSARDAWLRVWSEVYVLAHLVNRPRPRVPVTLRERWATLPQRLRECALATALDEAVQRRSQVLRSSFDPGGLSAACAASAAGMLSGGNGAGTMPGTTWVIPQLQWLHELERVCSRGGQAPDPFGLAPPLDYSLPDLAGDADVKIGQRIAGLRRHPLSMEVPQNRLIAWTALLGTDDHDAFSSDLAAVAIGVSHRGQLGMVAGEMGVAGWLEAVLSWPRRFIVGADDQAASPAPEASRAAR
jgi:DNA helicase HerA-like ATPase